jgi:ABC-type Zn uptake system ZnuABC Zn-binding protein ZnuA
MAKIVTAIAGALLACVALTGCGADGSASAGGGGVKVVATTALVADLVQAAAGDRAEVTALIPANADPHEYEPRPRDIAALADAKLVVRSGGDLDDWLVDALDNAGGSPQVLTLLDEVDAIPDDPHWWHDPRNAERAVSAIEAQLAAVDPDGRAAYERASDAYASKLRTLDEGIANCIDSIPPESRKLVTSHDALGYYAQRYGLVVIGTVIPSLSTKGQPSAGETTALAEAIRKAKVPVIFAESSVEPKVEKAIADEAGARVGRPLFADGLGPEGSDGATYLGAMRSNTLAIADGLGGRCELPG